MERPQRRNVSWVRGKCIGRGSFGTVNLAFSKSDGAVFAVKSVDRSSALPQQIESLENEIEILRSLSSPFVVEYLGDDETREASTVHRNLHIEYVPGGTLADVAGGDVDERLVRFYTWCVVSALRYVHSRGIVHCDVKGRNVLVGPDRVKLADFGSAVQVSGGSPIRPRGSPLWMAPEVIRCESQGPESDVWSLGCTIVEMITGKPAWEDCGADTLSRIAYSDELPAFPTRLSELGCDFLEKCLRRDPNQRWSCDQLLKHPFLLSASPAESIESSPRCVLDWVNSEFDRVDTDDEEQVTIMNCNSDSETTIQRIGKLAGNGGANWESESESDGWVTVRTWEEGTCSEFENRGRAEEEKAGTSAEYSDSSKSGGTKWEYLKLECGDANGCGWCRAGSSCRYGSACEQVEQRVEMSSDRSHHLSAMLFFYCCYHYFWSNFSYQYTAFPYVVYSFLYKSILLFVIDKCV